MAAQEEPIVVPILPYQDPMNSYYIYPNENPSLILVSPPLDGTNYHARSIAMAMSLQMKNKYEFLDGSIAQPPPTDPLFVAWKRCNTLVFSWLLHCLLPEIATSVISLGNASKVWKALKDRFSQGDHFRISQLQFDLLTLKQGDSTVTSYFTKKQVLWDELENFRQIPPNTCCELAKIVQQYRDNDHVICFLRGLNENFSAASSQILMTDPLPPLSKAFALIIQQERHLNIAILPDPVILTVQSRLANNGFQGQPKSYPAQQRNFNGKKGGNGGDKHCTHCGRNNHTIDTCFFKHGFPPGYKSKKALHNLSAATTEENQASSIIGLTKEQLQGIFF